MFRGKLGKLHRLATAVAIVVCCGGLAACEAQDEAPTREDVIAEAEETAYCSSFYHWRGQNFSWISYCIDDVVRIDVCGEPAWEYDCADDGQSCVEPFYGYADCR